MQDLTDRNHDAGLVSGCARPLLPPTDHGVDPAADFVGVVTGRRRVARHSGGHRPRHPGRLVLFGRGSSRAGGIWVDRLLRGYGVVVTVADPRPGWNFLRPHGF